MKLLILQFLTAKALQFTLKTAMDIILGALNEYHSKCVYILNSYEHGWLQDDKMAYMKYFAKSGNIPIASISFTELLLQNGGSYYQYNRPLNVITSHDNTTKTYLTQFSSRKSMCSSKWLMFLQANLSLDDFFIGVNIPHDCEFIVVQRLNHFENAELVLSLTEIYRQYYHHKLQKNIVATWARGRFNWREHSLLKRSNLQGEEDAFRSKCFGFEDKSFCILYYELWRIIEYVANIKSEYLIASNEYPGHKIGNRTWTDAMGLMISGKADIGLNYWGMTSERAAVASYISTAFVTKLTIYVKKEPEDSSRWNHILQPFSTWFWWTVVVSFGTLTLVLCCTGYVYDQMGVANRREDLSISSAWLPIVGILCQQGYTNTPTTWSGRLVYLTALFTYIIIFTAYSAIFISILTVQRYRLPFHNFQELLDLDSYNFGTIGNAMYLGIFQDASDPVLRKIYHKMLAPNVKSLPGVSYGDGLQRVCVEKRFAFTASEESVFAQKLSCNVLSIPETAINFPVSIMISKTSPYKRLLSHIVETLRRTGILSRIHSKSYWKTEDPEFPKTQARFVDVLPIILILSGGICASILCLIIERTIYYSY
ncbi:Ionotropic receptor 174 [Blattella germanica]|nr:Ionotropic receptor 174 [Blattella germanica]